MKILKKVSYDDFIKTNEYVAKTTPMQTHYLSPNPAERLLWKEKKRQIHEALRNLPVKSVIDLGSGDSGMLEAIPEKISYQGIDISPTQIKYAKETIRKSRRTNATVKQGDILNLKVKDGSFDAALLCDVVEHVLEPEKLFKEVKRIVKKNGYIIISLPNETLWQIMRLVLLRFPLHSPDHIHAFIPSDIQKVFKKIESKKYIPIPFSSHLSLIHIFVIKNT